MQRTSKLYFILTYLGFIYPPFIWGLVLIYNVRNGLEDHILSLIVNIVLLVVIAGIIWLLGYTKKIHLPNKLEQKYLLFGLFGNIVVYLYTFQNPLNIDNIVTIYLVLFLVLVMYFLLIKRVFKPLELWVLLPIFFLIDILHLGITGCGYNDWRCDPSRSSEPIIFTLYYIMILTIVVSYVYKIMLLKTYDGLKYVHIGLLILIAILFQNTDNLQYKFTQTILITFAFLIVLDFIIRIVNKTYTIKMLLFYIRTLTLLVIFMILGTTEFFINPQVEGEMLILMVFVTYVSLFINIIKSQFNVSIPDQNPITLFSRETSKYIPHECAPDEVERLTDLPNQEAILYTDIDGNIKGYIVYEVENKDITSLVINDITIDEDLLTTVILNEIDKLYNFNKAMQVIIKKYQITSEETLLRKGYLPINTPLEKWYIKH